MTEKSICVGYNFVTAECDASGSKNGGLKIWMLREIAWRLNATIQLIDSGNVWGLPVAATPGNSNGNTGGWTGSMGKLLRGEIDVAPCFFYHNKGAV